MAAKKRIAHFAIVDGPHPATKVRGPHVVLVGANGEPVMWSENYADKRDAEHVMEIVGEAVDRVMGREKPGST